MDLDCLTDAELLNAATLAIVELRFVAPGERAPLDYTAYNALAAECIRRGKIRLWLEAIDSVTPLARVKFLPVGAAR